MSAKTAIHVGDVVRFLYGTSKVSGTVKEDRGPIGLKGRRLYLIDFAPAPESPSQIELPAELLELSAAWAVLTLGRGGVSMEQSQNVASVTDNGGPGCDLTLTFKQPLADDRYVCQASADRDVNYRIVTRTRTTVRLVLAEPVPERVEVACFEQ